MIAKRDEFIDKFLKILKRKLEKALPDEGFESKMLETAMQVDISSSDHILGKMKEEHLNDK